METIKTLVETAVKQLFGLDVEIELDRPDQQFGDYSCNVAMKLARDLGRSPREIAGEIAGKISNEVIKSVEVAGPGFLNITLGDYALIAQLETEPAKMYQDDSVVIETNNPNPFKAMHIGHAFNAILGDTIANLIEQGGANTYRVSYHGDVGTHVGRSMYSLLKFVEGNPEKLNEIKPEERNSFMSRMYAEGSMAAKDESINQEIDRLAQMSFSREDSVYAAVYDTIFNWSFEQIDETVARLGNKPVEKRFLESDAEERGVKIVRDNTPAVFKESDGALVFEGSKYGAFDNAFVSSKGTGLYAARDLGLIQLKNEQYHPDKSFIITAEEQRDYFKGVIAAAELCMPELKDVTANISTGTVKLSSGKMSSRDGDVLEIAWLFDQIAEAIKKSDGGNASDEMIASAVRYEFLKVRIGSDVVFDIDQAVSISGNSGPYLQYAYARACSILAKADGGSLDEGVELLPEERILVRKLTMYSEVVDQATLELMPHHICSYLFELAQEFNRFYEKNRVIGDSRQDIRLGLVEMYKVKLGKGLAVLGIHAPEKM